MKRKDKAPADATLSARINAGSESLRASIAKPDNGAPQDADNGAPQDADNGAPQDADNGAQADPPEMTQEEIAAACEEIAALHDGTPPAIGGVEPPASLATADNGAPQDADNGAPDTEWEETGCRIRKGGADKRKTQFRGAGAESAILSATVETAVERGWFPEGTLREQVHSTGALIALRIRTTPDHLKRCRERFTEAAKAIVGTGEDEVRERKAFEHGAMALARWQTAAYDTAMNGGISKGAIKSVSAVIFASSVSVSASCKGIE